MVDPLSPGFRDGLPGNFAERPLTKEDRELQTLEGRPPLDVPSTSAQVLSRRRRADPSVHLRLVSRDCEQDERDSGSAEQEREALIADAAAEQATAGHGNAWDTEPQDADGKDEEESSGHLLDSRS